MYSFDPGEHTITWDGRDQDGEILPAEQYTYYIWGFDNKSAKQNVSTFLLWERNFASWSAIQEIDEAGLPLANPIWQRGDMRWIIGSDPLDESALMTTDVILPEGWEWKGRPQLQPDNFDNYYLSVLNTDAKQQSIAKLSFVPGGESIMDMTWGVEDGFADILLTKSDILPGVVSDGNYLYTTNGINYSDTSMTSDFHIYSTDGDLLDSIDLTEWWSSEGDFEQGGERIGGPETFDERNGYIFLNSTFSCMNQMVSPRRYLESGDPSEFFLWSNGNGDVVGDHNFEVTATYPWVCNDRNVGVYKYSVSADDNLFSAVNAYDAGAVTFGLFAPDGTGMGYYAVANENSGWKRGIKFLDSDTPFDGLYCDNGSMAGAYYNKPYIDPIKIKGVFYLAHDSVKGYININAHCLNGFISLNMPQNGEVLQAGSYYDIIWDICELPPFKLEFSANNGESWQVIAKNVDAKKHYYHWKVPDISSESCLLRPSMEASEDYYRSFSIIGGVSVKEGTPHIFSLSPNHPNPFNPVTSIPFSLAHESEISLDIYTVTGEKVTTLAESSFKAGSHSIDFDASEYSSGVYFYRITAGDFIETRKMMLVK